MILVLMGPPGAGKGTQAKLLAEHFKIPHISTGDMFRDHKDRGTELGQRIQAIMDAGNLVTDDITNTMVQQRLGRSDTRPGFILDGFPRTTAQAEFLAAGLHESGRTIDRVLHYQVPEALIVDRISGRRSCPKCGTVYHLNSQPPKRDGLCDREGQGLVQREDDRPENVKKRLAAYAEKTAPLRSWYEQRSLLTIIDGTGAPEAVLEATKKKLAQPAGATIK